MTQQRDQVKTVQATGELRCPRRLHAKIVDGVVEIHCRLCSTPRRRVYHRWDAVTEEPFPDRVEVQGEAAA